MPLSISIAPGSPESIHEQIVRQVVAGVVAGRLAEDEMLPSVRALGEMLAVHSNTVSKAYGELVRQGILEARPGKGMFVAPRRPQRYTRAERVRRVAPLRSAFLTEALFLGFTPEEIKEQVDDGLKELQPRRKRGPS